MDRLFSCCPYLIIFLILTGTVGITPTQNLVNDYLVTDLNTKKSDILVCLLPVCE